MAPRLETFSPKYPMHTQVILSSANLVDVAAQSP